jgi:hypothetical protein
MLNTVDLDAKFISVCFCYILFSTVTPDPGSPLFLAAFPRPVPRNSFASPNQQVDWVHRLTQGIPLDLLRPCRLASCMYAPVPDKGRCRQKTTQAQASHFLLHKKQGMPPRTA